MKVTITEKVETSHAWVGEDGKICQKVITFDVGDADSADLPVGDAERCLAKLVSLGHATELAE